MSTQTNNNQAITLFIYNLTLGFDYVIKSTEYKAIPNTVEVVNIYCK